MILLVSAILIAGPEAELPAAKAESAGKAPAFMLNSFGGKQISLADYAGKIVVLEWFNDECPFVQYHYEKASTMIELANKYKDKDIVWLAINSTSHTTIQQNKDIAAKYKLPYPILDDRSGAVGRAYRAKTTPHIYIIDAKGAIAYNGAIDNSPLGRNKDNVVNYVDRTLAELTAGKAVTTTSTEPYGCNVKYRKAPEFSLRTFDGKDVSLSDYEGKIVVLEWFNDECPFVKYHYGKPNTMVELANKYKGKDVVWLAVNSTAHATAEQNKDFAATHKLPYPILDDRLGTVGRAYNAKTTPHIYIIDKNGMIAYTGAVDNSPLGKAAGNPANYVDLALAELTNGKPVSTPATKPYGCNVKYRKAPPFELRTFDDKQVKLSDYEGKIVALEWFNDECPFVKYHYEKASTMIDLANKYKDKDVVWLAVNSTAHTTPQQNKDFARKYKLPYPILDDRPGTVGKIYAARSTPHMFVIDAKGMIVYSGAIDNSPLGKRKEGVVNYVDEALKQLPKGRTIAIPATKPYGCNVKYAP
jgi:peroxiredoxin